MDEAAQAQLIPYNPVRLCQEPKTEEYKTAPLRLGQLQRYLNAAEQLGVLPLIYTGLSCGLRQCELITLSWADFHVRYRSILKGQRLLMLNAKGVVYVCVTRRRAYEKQTAQNVIGLADAQTDAETISRLIKERITP